MTDIASLGISIQSDSAKSAKTDLDNLTSAAQKAETGVAGAGRASETAGSQFEEFAVHARNHIASLLGATEGTRAYLAIAARVAPTLLLGVAALEGVNALLSAGASINDGFARSLAQTDNATGATVSQLGAYADQIARSGVGTKAAADAIDALVSTTKVGATNLQQFGQAAADANKYFGTSFQDTAKNFADIADAPVAALGALHALTPALQDQILALISQGRAIDAVTLAQTAYSNAVHTQVETLKATQSTYTNAWGTIGEAAHKAWDEMLGLGRQDTIQQQLDALVKARGSRALGTVEVGDQGTTGGGPDSLADMRASLTGSAAGQRAADAQETMLRNQIAASNASATKAAAAAAAGQQLLRDNATAVVNDQASIALGNIQLQASIQSVTDALAKQSIAVQSDSSVLETLHGAGLITDTQYYDTRRQLIEADTAAQVSALNQQIALVQRQTALTDQSLADERKRASADLTPQGAANVAQLGAQQSQNDAQGAAKVAALRDQISQKQIAGSDQVTQSFADQYVASQNLQKQIDQLTSSSQLYVKSLTDQYAISEASVSLSDQQAQKLSELTDIQKHFNDVRNQLQKDAADRPGNSARDLAGIQAQNAAQAQAEAALAQHYKTLDTLQGDWTNGAAQAFANYEDSAKNVAAVASKSFTDAFSQMDDALVQFAATGKLNFGSLATSILEDIDRIALKAAESKIFSLFGGGGFLSQSASDALGSAASAAADSVTFAASGANASAGQPFVIGEQGPELFVPTTSGTIVPNGKWQQSGAGIVINQQINAAPNTDVGALQYAMQAAKEQAKAEIYDSIMRGQWKPALQRGIR